MNSPETSRAPVRVLLFDMDNTLFDLVGAQIASCRNVAGYLGQDDGESLFEYFLRPDRGFESHENIRDYMGDRTIPGDCSYEKACRIYETEKLRSITPYPGVRETLRELFSRGYLMGIVTDAHSRDATLRLERIGLLPFFTVIVAWDMTGKKKPACEPFLVALEMLKASSSETLLIGDSPRRDIEPCRPLGIRTVYARYGDRFSPERTGVASDYTIDSMEELVAILDGIAG